MFPVRPVLIALAALTALFCGSVAVAQPIFDTARGFGIWRNPKNSVHVEIKSCGGAACGYVVWANATAREDARRGGSDTLIGLRVLRDFVPETPDRWRGKVFAPDMGMTFSGTAEFLDAGTMRAKGCLVGRVLCKAQIWKRVETAAD